MRLSFSWYVGKQLKQTEKNCGSRQKVIPVLTKVEWFSINEQMF